MTAPLSWAMQPFYTHLSTPRLWSEATDLIGRHISLYSHAVAIIADTAIINNYEVPFNSAANLLALHSESPGMC